MKEFFSNLLKFADAVFVGAICIAVVAMFFILNDYIVNKIKDDES